ncbi:MAG: serine/threonine-protein kinase [Myxococcales bacterium]|nr:serine/threonine protein kinase [Polyangiaceae bacterium]MDW8248769.1 serine/threonine-protein kinase [Myxococcales bacterium]
MPQDPQLNRTLPLDTAIPSRTLPLPGRGPLASGAEQGTREERRAFQRSLAVLPRRGKGLEPSLSGGERPRYELVKRLGEGSFGEVSLVHDNDIARKVAMKRLKAGTEVGEPLLRFIDEIQVVGQLEHPSIPPIHDVGLDENGYFFIMKYVEGETLDAIIEHLLRGDPTYHQRFSYKARAELFLRILQAIQFAHEKGILHRDLKPENIMVGPYGEVMIMDWGLAKRLSDPVGQVPAEASASPEGSLQGSLGGERLTSTRVGTIVGSPAYMSPEQARGRLDLIDVRSDLYSLAAVFYELMTLDHYLTPKQTQQQMLVGVVSEEPLSPIAMHHRYGIPPEFTFFLRKGLEKDPALRFQTAREMADRLRAILDGDIPVQCPCTGLKAAGNRWFRFIDAHPVGAVVAAILASGCAAYGAYGVVRQLIALAMR